MDWRIPPSLLSSAFRIHLLILLATGLLSESSGAELDQSHSHYGNILKQFVARACADDGALIKRPNKMDLYLQESASVPSAQLRQ